MTDESGEISLRVIGNDDKLFKFKIAQDELLAVLIRKFCQEYEVPVPHMQFFYHKTLIQFFDTPKSLNLSENDIIEAKGEFDLKEQAKETFQGRIKQLVWLKVSYYKNFDDLNPAISKNVQKRSQQLGRFMNDYCGKLNLLREFTNFYFRDKLIADNDTPDSLDMKNQDSIKVYRDFDYPDSFGTNISLVPAYPLDNESLQLSETQLNETIDLSEDSGFFDPNRTRKLNNDSQNYETIDLSQEPYQIAPQNNLKRKMEPADYGIKVLDLSSEFSGKSDSWANIGTSNFIKGFKNRIDYGVEELRSTLSKKKCHQRDQDQKLVLRVSLCEGVNSPRVDFYDIRPTETFERLMKLFCGQTGLLRQGVRFLYDGEQISDTATPVSFNMKNKDTIEVFKATDYPDPDGINARRNLSHKSDSLANVGTNNFIKGFENRIDYGVEKLRSNLLSDSQNDSALDETICSDPFLGGFSTKKKRVSHALTFSSTPKRPSQPGTSKSFLNSYSLLDLIFDNHGDTKSYKSMRYSPLGPKMELYCTNAGFNFADMIFQYKGKTLSSSHTPVGLRMFSGDKIKVIAKNPQNIELNIQYKGNNHKIHVDNFAPLLPTIKIFCVGHGFNRTGLQFLYGDTQILPSSTPRSLKMNKGDVIEITNNYQININVYNDGKTTRLMMKRFQGLHFLMNSYCSIIGERDISKFNFYYRGKAMSSASTPDSLKMNDGDIVQVYKKK